MHNSFTRNLRAYTSYLPRSAWFGIIGLLLVGGLSGCNGAAQANSSKSAKTSMSGMIASQEKFHTQKQRFATSIASLASNKNAAGDWISKYENNSDGYQFRLEIHPNAMFISGESVINPSLKKLVAASFGVDKQGKSKSILCEAAAPGDAPIAYPPNADSCGPNSVKVSS